MTDTEIKTPAEEFVNNIIRGIRQRSKEINSAIEDYKKESEILKPTWKPLTDVLETNETFYIISDLPEVKKEDLDIGITKNSVEITAKFKEGNEIIGAKFIKKERNYGEIRRTIELPTDIKINDVKAKFKGCTLTITLPKTEKDMTNIIIE